MAFHYSPKIVSDGLVFCVDPVNPKSYIGSGSYSTDVITKKNGSLLNGAYYSSNSFTFDGVNDYIDFGYISELDLTRFTVSIWYKGSPSGGNSMLIEKRHGTNNDNYVNFCILWNSNNNAYDAFTSNGSTYKEIPLTLSISNSTYHNFILSYDGTTLKTYVDATLVGSLVDTFTPYTSGTQNLRIGSSNYSGGTRYAMGNSSHATIYNRSLSQTEITQNFNALRGRFGI